VVEIYNFIAYIPHNQIFNDKNKNDRVKGANSNQVYNYMRGNFKFVSFCQRVFYDKINLYL